MRLSVARHLCGYVRSAQTGAGLDGFCHVVHLLGLGLPDPPVACHPLERRLFFRPWRVCKCGLFTPDGWLFLAIGTVVSAILNAVLFSVTILAMPLLLDGDTDLVTATQTSINGVRQNPVVMLGWAAIVGATVLISMLPAFLGLLVTLPVLGHTTWHLYRRAIDHSE